MRGLCLRHSQRQVIVWFMSRITDLSSPGIRCRQDGINLVCNM
jgi:hypothetical protein